MPMYYLDPSKEGAGKPDVIVTRNARTRRWTAAIVPLAIDPTLQLQSLRSYKSGSKAIRALRAAAGFGGHA